MYVAEKLKYILSILLYIERCMDFINIDIEIKISNFTSFFHDICGISLCNDSMINYVKILLYENFLNQKNSNVLSIINEVELNSDMINSECLY